MVKESVFFFLNNRNIEYIMLIFITYNYYFYNISNDRNKNILCFYTSNLDYFECKLSNLTNL